MTSAEDFVKALDADPSNSFLRLLYADWLEEVGDSRAAGYRAIGIWKTVPCYYDAKSSVDDIETYCFWKGWWKHPSHDYLPEDWFWLLAGYRPLNEEVNNFRNYDSRQQCEDAAALAFLRLPTERQQELLQMVMV